MLEMQKQLIQHSNQVAGALYEALKANLKKEMGTWSVGLQEAQSLNQVEMKAACEAAVQRAESAQEGRWADRVTVSFSVILFLATAGLLIAIFDARQKAGEVRHWEAMARSSQAKLAALDSMSVKISKVPTEQLLKTLRSSGGKIQLEEDALVIRTWDGRGMKIYPNPRQ